MMTNIALDLLFVVGWVVFAGLVVAERNRVAKAVSRQRVSVPGPQAAPAANEAVVPSVESAVWTELDDRQLVRLLSDSSP